MKACVLVKEVPDARASRAIDPASGRLDREVESGLNPYDRHALEAAVQLRESAALGALEIVAVTMGPAQAQRTLRRAATLGADRLVHLCDPALAGSDAAGTGYALAQILRAERPDLVLCGQQSDDAATAVVPAIVAEHLQFALATQATSLQAADGRVVIERQTELGSQVLELALPAVISLATSANTPRYVSLKQTLGAAQRAIETVTCAQAGIDPTRVGAAGAAALCGDWHAPPLREPGVVVHNRDTAATVGLILAWLSERGLIA